MSGPVNRTLADTKRHLFAALPHELVEIGPGIGANFEYYAAGTTVYAHEPNHGMHRMLAETANIYGIQLHLSSHDLRDAGYPPNSFDVVLSTLVMCSVEDPIGLVDTIYGLLRPGGRLIFIEHIAPQSGTAAALIARTVRRPWAALGDHCNVMAETDRVISNAGFASVDARVEPFGGRLDPSSDHYWGVATK